MTFSGYWSHCNILDFFCFGTENKFYYFFYYILSLKGPFVLFEVSSFLFAREKNGAFPKVRIYLTEQSIKDINKISLKLVYSSF